MVSVRMRQQKPRSKWLLTMRKHKQTEVLRYSGVHVENMTTLTDKETFTKVYVESHGYTLMSEKENF